MRDVGGSAVARAKRRSEWLMHRVQKMLSTDEIRPNPRNARTHSKRQIREIEASIQAFGFTSPVLVDESLVLIAGHGRLKAAKNLGILEVPAIVLPGLGAAKKRALLIADNKVAQNAGWDLGKLATELPELAELLVEDGLDISITGFAPVEIDRLATDFEADSSDPADDVSSAWSSSAPISQTGDVWRMRHHRLMCGDARSRPDLDRLMGAERAAIAFLDPPYNVRVSGIGGRGRTKHGEFAMASGEMSRPEFTRFLSTTLLEAARVSEGGAVHFVCIDWRHLPELLEAGEGVYGQMLNLAVWAKTNAGQGAFYRSQHELIGVYRVGDAPHLNNVELGRHGRSRSNVWHYAGVNAFRAGRDDELRAHPTVKPVALVADALKDCSRRGDIVLDTFSGAGTTIMAAERVGRRASALELDPRYVDVAVRRWQAFARADAVHADTGRTFDEVAAERGSGTSHKPARPRRAASR